MSEEAEEVEVEESSAVQEEAEETKSAPKKRLSGPRLLGRMIGAGVALPTAAVVFCVAGFAGVPASTALSRSLLTAVLMWILVGLAIRFLFTFVIHDWRQKLHSEVPQSELIDD